MINLFKPYVGFCNGFEKGTIVEQKTVFLLVVLWGLISKGSSNNDFNQPQAT